MTIYKVIITMNVSTQGFGIAKLDVSCSGEKPVGGKCGCHCVWAGINISSCTHIYQLSDIFNTSETLYF